MKKKVISALLASTMIVSLVACGSTGGDSSDTNSKSSGTTASSTAGGDEAKDTSSDSGSGDAAGSGDWVAAADEADDAVPGENDDRAFAKFDHVVEVHYGYQIDPKDTTLPDGDSVDNNQYTRYLLDNYNIKVVCDWTAGNASDFQQKVSLAIASASLPDAVVAPTRNYLVQAARADLLAGLSPDYAIAGIDNGGRTYSNFLNSSNNGYGFDAVYQAFNATPGYFLKDDSGELYWGTTTDEMKEALTTLHDWYEKGLINPEVGTTTNGDNANNVKNGTCGIFMGPWWSLGYGNPDSFRNDNNANWQAYPLYTKDGEWNIHMKDVGTTYTMVNKNASDDVKKAIVIMNNVLVRDESTFDTSVAIGWYPLRNTMAATDECEYEYDALMGIIKGEASADDYQQGGSKFNGLYKNLVNDAATLKDVISEDYDGSRDLAVTDMDVNTNNGQFNRFYALLIGDRPYATLEPDHKIYSELYYTIDGMDTYWTQISDLEDKSILQFITGAKSLDEWDQFCTDWHVQGGDQILELVKDYLAE